MATQSEVAAAIAEEVAAGARGQDRSITSGDQPYIRNPTLRTLKPKLLI
jgi:hypothetical protein